ncbi:conserved hypothetical protein [Nitrosomonas nitrosa]|uniref:Lipoprotein n=1 Tax=Nitrosomonas nitrosa TaxID=52442 RepID=A0A8H8Z1N9_9PROT|nr:hypothetical protein [Nitrosomonas nitrosa]CAE6506757.1 conserved hypothetical protein [Nitrosomonas nitrosa]
MMKLISILLMILVTISVLTLTGCKPTDGNLELKEPNKELSEMPERKNWSVRDAEGFDEK